METRFNFQINPECDRKDWEDVPVITLFISERQTAVRLATQAARDFKAEVRLTEGLNPLGKSGAYFRYDQQ